MRLAMGNCMLRRPQRWQRCSLSDCKRDSTGCTLRGALCCTARGEHREHWYGFRRHFLIAMMSRVSVSTVSKCAAVSEI